MPRFSPGYEEMLADHRFQPGRSPVQSGSSAQRCWVIRSAHSVQASYPISEAGGVLPAGALIGSGGTTAAGALVPNSHIGIDRRDRNGGVRNKMV